MLGGDDTSIESLSTSLLYQATELVSSMGHYKFAIGFGHRRLSILDLSAYGHQPMCSREGNLWITYNGEIYNYFEIRKLKLKTGHMLKKPFHLVQRMKDMTNANGWVSLSGIPKLMLILFILLSKTCLS